MISHIYNKIASTFVSVKFSSSGFLKKIFVAKPVIQKKILPQSKNNGFFDWIIAEQFTIVYPNKTKVKKWYSPTRHADGYLSDKELFDKYCKDLENGGGNRL